MNISTREKVRPLSRGASQDAGLFPNTVRHDEEEIQNAARVAAGGQPVMSTPADAEKRASSRKEPYKRKEAPASKQLGRPRRRLSPTAHTQSEWFFAKSKSPRAAERGVSKRPSTRREWPRRFAHPLCSHAISRWCAGRENIHIPPHFRAFKERERATHRFGQARTERTTQARERS